MLTEYWEGERGKMEEGDQKRERRVHVMIVQRKRERRRVDGGGWRSRYRIVSFLSQLRDIIGWLVRGGRLGIWALGR